MISPLAKGNAYDSTLTYTHSSDLKTMQELFGVYGPGEGSWATRTPRARTTSLLYSWPTRWCRSLRRSCFPPLAPPACRLALGQKEARADYFRSNLSWMCTSAKLNCG